jgi:protein-S-isoprenylcysteine O-methyltransferase Ste14
MRLIERMEREGESLFRWRSYAPLILLPLFFLALRDSMEATQLLGSRTQDAWSVIVLSISLLGLAVRWATVGFVAPGTSGRSTREQRAAKLNTTGTYSIVRNPLYLGNFITLLGVALATMSWWFVMLFVFIYWVYIERVIAAEESFLARRFGAEYAAWVERTPVFVPRFRLWRHPDRSLSVRAILRREYNGVLAVASAFLAMQFAIDVAFAGVPPKVWMVGNWGWIALFAAAAAGAAILRTLKHRTCVLDAPPGRAQA